MNSPQITYHVLTTDESRMQKNSVYAGTYTGDNALSVSLRIWNNYKGTEDVEDLENFNLVAKFINIEDSVLLPYLSIVSDTNLESLSMIIEDKAAVFTFMDTVILSGAANTGSDEYRNNYVDITISVNPISGVYLKDHDLKSLVLDIVEI